MCWQSCKAKRLPTRAGYAGEAANDLAMGLHAAPSAKEPHSEHMFGTSARFNVQNHAVSC